MEIKFTQKEFEALLKLTLLTDFVVQLGQEGLEDGDYNDFMAVIDKIYHRAANSPLSYLVEKAEEGKYEPSFGIVEDPTLAFLVKSFEDNIFWAHLCQELAMRDIMDTMSWDEYNGLNPAKKADLLQKYLTKYFQEFEENGVERLYIAE